MDVRVGSLIRTKRITDDGSVIFGVVIAINPDGDRFNNITVCWHSDPTFPYLYSRALLDLGFILEVF